MIYETLAAIADYNNNLKFDLTSTELEANETLVAYRDRDGSVDKITRSGSLTIPEETLTINGVVVSNSKVDVLDDWLVAIQNKTPRTVVDNELAPDSLSKGVITSFSV